MKLEFILTRWNHNREWGKISFPRWHHFPEPEERSVGREQDMTIGDGFCSHSMAVFSNQMMGISGHLGCKLELAVWIYKPKRKWLECRLLTWWLCQGRKVHSNMIESITNRSWKQKTLQIYLCLFIFYLIFLHLLYLFILGVLG